MQQTRKAPKVAKFKGKSELRGGLNVEGNVSPRAILTKDGIKKVNVKTANALLELGSIIDLGKGIFLDADMAASAFGGEVGDEFRYSDIGLDEVGIGIGKKIGESGQIGLKGTYRPISSIRCSPAFALSRSSIKKRKPKKRVTSAGNTNSPGLNLASMSSLTSSLREPEGTSFPDTGSFVPPSSFSPPTLNISICCI